jgi:copper(I)-binding protein
MSTMIDPGAEHGSEPAPRPSPRIEPSITTSAAHTKQAPSGKAARSIAAVPGRWAAWGVAGLLLLAGALVGAGLFWLRAPAPGAASGAASGPAIVVEGAWARAATRPSDAPGGTSAVYLTLRNEGPAEDRLLGAAGDAAVTTEVHQSTVEDGVMRMRPAGPLSIPAGGALTLQPGGIHVMLIDLRRDLTAGEQVTVTLQFERAGDVVVNAEVRPPTMPTMSGPMPAR